MNPLKTGLAHLGFWILKLFPNRGIENIWNKKDHSLLKKLTASYVSHLYSFAPETVKVQINTYLWTTKASDVYFERSASTVNNSYQAHLLELIAEIQKNNSISRIVEIGCGNGQMIAQIHRALKTPSVGIDLSVSQIHKNQQAFPDLEWFAGSFEDWIPHQDLSNHIFLTLSVLTTFESQVLRQFFSLLKQKGLSFLVSTEPLDTPPGDWIQMPRSGLAYSYDYKKLLEEAGARVIYYKIPDKFPANMFFIARFD